MVRKHCCAVKKSLKIITVRNYFLEKLCLWIGNALGFLFSCSPAKSMQCIAPTELWWPYFVLSFSFSCRRPKGLSPSCLCVPFFHTTRKYHYDNCRALFLSQDTVLPRLVTKLLLACINSIFRLPLCPWCLLNKDYELFFVIDITHYWVLGLPQILLWRLCHSPIQYIVMSKISWQTL